MECEDKEVSPRDWVADEAKLTRGRGVSEDDPGLFTLSFSSASLSPLTLCEVSSESPSLRELLEPRRDPGAGADTDRGDCRG